MGVDSGTSPSPRSTAHCCLPLRTWSGGGGAQGDSAAAAWVHRSRHGPPSEACSRGSPELKLYRVVRLAAAVEGKRVLMCQPIFCHPTSSSVRTIEPLCSHPVRGGGERVQWGRESRHPKKKATDVFLSTNDSQVGPTPWEMGKWFCGTFRGGNLEDQPFADLHHRAQTAFR